jgi:hypothetical protein
MQVERQTDPTLARALDAAGRGEMGEHGAPEPDDHRQIEVTPISFREEVPEILATDYLTHAIYTYPARFIPQAVRYCIRACTREGDCIVDPFAGSGTVGLEAYLLRRNAFLLDINPLLDHIIPIKVYTGRVPPDLAVLREYLHDMTENGTPFHPRWSNIGYWYPPPVYDRLARCWGWVHAAEPDSVYVQLITAALAKASRYFSYADHTASKLFRTRRKDRLIAQLLQGDWEARLIAMVGARAEAYLSDVNALIARAGDCDARIVHHGGVDSVTYPYDPHVRFDALITSPPYLQAQEYLRTAKLDLYWMGHTEEEVRALTRLEIPYRKPERVIRTETLDALKAEVSREGLVRMLDSYFYHTIRALENAMARLEPGSRACIFAGNPKTDGKTVEIWRILAEHFSGRGYRVERVYEDTIKVRRLFGSRKNKNPEGMKTEYLLLLRKD